MTDLGPLSAGAGGQVAWELQSLEVALGGTLTQGSPSKVGGPSVTGRDLIQGGNINLPKGFCFSQKSFLTIVWNLEAISLLKHMRWKSGWKADLRTDLWGGSCLLNTSLPRGLVWL